jgi:hypothetical protein
VSFATRDAAAVRVVEDESTRLAFVRARMTMVRGAGDLLPPPLRNRLVRALELIGRVDSIDRSRLEREARGLEAYLRRGVDPAVRGLVGDVAAAASAALVVPPDEADEGEPTQEAAALGARIEALWMRRTGAKSPRGARAWMARTWRVQPLTVSRWLSGARAFDGPALAFLEHLEECRAPE